MTASGGNLIKGELNRSKRAPLCGVTPTEVAWLGVSRVEYPWQ